MDILIVGAGIGGLTAGLLLDRLDLRVTIVEAASAIEPLGVGINLLPHGAAVLWELGLGERLAATGIETRSLEYRTRFGQLILADPRGRHAGLPWPHLSIHRGDLQTILLEAARARFGERILTGHRFERFKQDERGVTAFLHRRADGADVTMRADALIGADGIHSRLCRELHPGIGPLRFSGVIMWRGAVERAPYLDGRTMVIAGHHATKAVIYPISGEAAGRGRSLVNWVAELRVGESAPYERADWNRFGTIDEFIAPFEDWRFDWLDIPALFRATKEIYVYPMVDRDPLPRWSFGRVTLLGDAAHPMYPIGANGGSQAIIDADALAVAFTEHGGDVESALAAYETARREATSQVTLSNRAKGPERVLVLAHERVRRPEDDVTKLITKAELDAITLDYRKVAGFDLETLQRRAAKSSPS
jgi:2-polyprenyl-6-methoxyphenol hydroxylase-like FAD-dependent oxidoreductase